MEQPEQAAVPLLDAAVLTRCRHRVFLDATGARPEPAPLDSGVALRQEAAVAHRAAVRARLGGVGAGGAGDGGAAVVDVSGAGSRAARAAATLAAARAGAERVWGAVLPADPVAGMRGGAELLVRHGDGYLPVLVVNHRVTDAGSGALTSGLHQWDPRSDPDRSPRRHPRDQLHLAHLWALLRTAGLASTAPLGGVIGLDADCVLVHELDAPSWPGGLTTQQVHAERLADRVAVASGALTTAPSRVSECRTCPWWPRCGAELRTTHDVSLVVRGAQADQLRTVGVHTVDDLAAWVGPGPAAWSGGGFTEAVVLAQAWLVQAPLVRRAERVAVVRADVEVDVDMESYLEDGAYLWGTLRTEDGRTDGYRPFVTWDPLPTDDEARSFAAFWAWLTAQRDDAAARGRTFAAYCYSEAAENRWLLGSAGRFAGRPGIPPVAEVQAFIDSEQWVDLFAAVGVAFLCPQGRGLKKVAPVAGFTWRDAEAGGEASMGWYRRAVGLDGAIEPAQRRRLLDYNADDVWATKVLREWMSSPAVRSVPVATDL